jgi:hypothetical protein
MKALGHFYFLLGIGALALLAIALGIRKSLARRYRLPYVADRVLFSPAQLGFLRVLERALGKDYRVFGRVRAMDAIDLRRRLDRRTKLRAWERLARHRFDFLVCHARTSEIACAINLAPPSRLRRGVPRDSLDSICEAAGLPFLRFREAERYSQAQIGERVLGAIRAAGKDVREPPARPATVSALGPEEIRDLESLGRISIPEDRRPERLRRSSEIARPAAPLAQAEPAKPLTSDRAVERQVAASAAPPPVPPPAPEALPRIEPKILGYGDIDLGPSFRIDGDLDDDEPRAHRRGRPGAASA